MCGIRRGLNFDFLRKGGKVRLRGAPLQAPLARSWIPHVGEGFDFERKIFWARDRSDFSIMNSNLEQIQERQRVRARIVSLATVVCLTAAMFTVTAFAANTDTAQGFQQITTAGIGTASAQPTSLFSAWQPHSHLSRLLSGALLLFWGLRKMRKGASP